MDDKTIQVTAYLLESLHAKLAAMAKAEHRSLSNMVVIAIDEFVRRAQPGGLPASEFQSNIRTAIPASRQMDITDAIAAAVKRGPVKSAKHK